MESFDYPQFSSTVHLALFNHVTNAAKLKARIVRASTLEGAEGQAEREAVNFAFVDARLVRHVSIITDSVIETSCAHCADNEHLTHSDGYYAGYAGCSTK